MFNITPQNYNVNFKGSFRSNELLQRSLLLASPEDLFEFSKNLKKMSAKKDKRVFWLSEDWNTTPFSILVKTHAIQLNTRNYGKTVINAVGKEAILRERKYSLACYKNVIKNINAALNKIYPDKSV